MSKITVYGVDVDVVNDPLRVTGLGVRLLDNTLDEVTENTGKGLNMNTLYVLFTMFLRPDIHTFDELLAITGLPREVLDETLSLLVLRKQVSSKASALAAGKIHFDDAVKWMEKDFEPRGQNPPETA